MVDAVQGHRQHPQAGGAAADAGIAAPPPPPPPPEKPPEPETPPEETIPEPEPLDQPTPAEEPTPTPDNADPVTMNADAQAGGDNFGIQSGSGGGSSGVGRGGAGNATYGRYLGYLMQQAISRDDKVKRLAFQLQVNVWLSNDGRLERSSWCVAVATRRPTRPCSMRCDASARSTRHRRRRSISPPAC